MGGLYVEATSIAAVLATSTDLDETKTARQRFWRLYWGDLAMVESPAVEAAMVRLGDALTANAALSDLQLLVLDLTKACRGSLDRSWGIHAWTEARRNASNA